MNSFFTYCTLNLCSCYLPISKISRKVIFLPSIFFHLWIGPLLWLGWKILSSYSLSPNIFEEKMRILITLKNHGQQHNHSPKMDDLTNTSLSALSLNSWINKKNAILMLCSFMNGNKITIQDIYYAFSWRPFWTLVDFHWFNMQIFCLCTIRK